MVDLPSHYTEKQRQAVLAVQRTLDNMDFGRYQGRVSWLASRPECPIYEGKSVKSLCSYWRGWIMSGRSLYPADAKGEREFLKRVKERTGGRIRKNDMDSILEKMNNSPLKNIFFFPQEKRVTQRP